ncbi:hypothetical protein ACFXKY_37040 [Streptomyces canus]|uniref:hypothetical protein n=1 Tax=Streptomyces canus TaxID=58343 RepID=UPI00367BFBE4
MMLAVNLGTRGILPALDLLEYANHFCCPALSDLRVANGTPDPHNFRMWCLATKSTGPGRPVSGMPTFGDWERTVLEHAYDHLDYVSCSTATSEEVP